MFIFEILLLLLYVSKSLQRCSSTVGVTTCSNEVLAENKPLQIKDYKGLLSFQNSQISKVPRGTFKLLPELRIIQLSNNLVSQLEDGSFEGLINLQELTLYNNQLRQIKNNNFRGCPKLQKLDLGMNKISSIETNSLSILAELDDLNLGFNQLTSIPKEVNRLIKLKTLSLQNNQIGTVEEGALDKLNSLEVLNLSDNKIASIKNNAFKGLNKLKDLNLKVNYLTAINVDDFLRNLKSLKIVRLNINSFTCQTLRDVISKFEQNSVEVAEGTSKSQNAYNGISCKV